MDYATVKLVHQSAVALSIGGFVLRGAGTFVRASWVGSRAARTLPHVVDTILLASAIALAWMLRISPLAAPWLLAKIIALVVYIALGGMAFDTGRTAKARGVAFIAAIATFGYIVSVALAKDPRGFLSWL